MNQQNNTPFRTSIGGQALMEGILMRGPHKQAIVCRTKDGLGLDLPGPTQEAA